MTQRAGLHQIKRTDINRKSFLEQYTQLEKNSAHQREPVQSAGDLPVIGNIPGSQCLVLDENTMYSWDQHLQNWKPVLGRSYEVSSNMHRYKRKYIATEGQQVFQFDFYYTVGENALDVYVQGMLQDVNQDYEETDERTITFREALPKDVIVTVATPMVIEGTYGVRAIEKRLKELEHNNYQLMMNQYYSGKPVDVKGLVFDGFINTNNIDFSKTSTNLVYDNLLQSMKLTGEMLTNFYETFDTLTEVDPTSTILVSNSEMTLPISETLVKVFADDFSSKDYIDEDFTNAYYDVEKQQYTTVDSYAGADHYYKGDFMSTTSSVDLVSWNTRHVSGRTQYYESTSNLSWRTVTDRTSLYSIAALQRHMVIANDLALIQKGYWPYDSMNGIMTGPYAWIWDNSSSDRSWGSNYYSRQIFPSGKGDAMRTMMVGIHSRQRLYFLYQEDRGSGKYEQTLYSADGNLSTLSLLIESGITGLPSTMLTSESTVFIDQIGSTKDHLLLRAKDVIYFIDMKTRTVVKTLDWSNAAVKPTIYNASAKQFTADGRYLYFPAMKTVGGKRSYYIEVFRLDDGSYVQDIHITPTNYNLCSAIAFDHTNHKLILGTYGGSEYKYTPVGKASSVYDYVANYQGMIVFEAPNVNERYVQSKKIYTNLPTITYKLDVDQQLNSGLIEYYISIGTDVWTKIEAGKEYTWKNPNGAKTVAIQLRAMLRTTNASTTSPTLTGWSLSMKAFHKEGLYQSKVKNIPYKEIVGGRIRVSQQQPEETSLQWTIQLANDKPETTIPSSGEFTLPEGLEDSDTIMRARLGTNNPLLSPVVQDMEVQLHKTSEGALESITFEQLEDINDVTMWVTTSTSHEHYRVYASRDGGKIWEPGKRNNVVKNNDGKVEVEWLLPFKLDSEERRKLKLKFEMDGVTEIYQYGAVISPV